MFSKTLQPVGSPCSRGIPLQGQYRSIPLDMGCHSTTPLKYFIEQKGTYQFGDVPNVFVSLTQQKRM